jgi:hypothetical protein
LDLLPGGQFVEREEVLLQVQVEIGLEVAEADWVGKYEFFEGGDVRLALDEDIVVEVCDDVIQFRSDDLFHVDFDFRFEVVDAVEESADVALEWPAIFAECDPFHECFEGEAFFEFAHVDVVLVVDETDQDLEVGDQVE